MEQSFYKSWLLVSKITWGTWSASENQTSKKLKFDGTLSKKCVLSPKTLDTEDSSNITFNYLFENSHNYLCHFWNYKSFFTTQLLCIFLAQTLHTFNKTSPIKCKVSDFPLFRLKFTKLLKSVFKWKVSFSSNFPSLFSVMRHNSSLHFHLNLCMLCTKGFSQSANFRTFDSSHEN